MAGNCIRRSVEATIRWLGGIAKLWMSITWRIKLLWSLISTILWTCITSRESHLWRPTRAMSRKYDYLLLTQGTNLILASCLGRESLAISYSERCRNRQLTAASHKIYLRLGCRKPMMRKSWRTSRKSNYKLIIITNMEWWIHAYRIRFLLLSSIIRIRVWVFSIKTLKRRTRSEILSTTIGCMRVLISRLTRGQLRKSL